MKDMERGMCYHYFTHTTQQPLIEREDDFFSEQSIVSKIAKVHLDSIGEEGLLQSIVVKYQLKTDLDKLHM